MFLILILMSFVSLDVFEPSESSSLCAASCLASFVDEVRMVLCRPAIWVMWDLSVWSCWEMSSICGWVQGGVGGRITGMGEESALPD